MKPRGVTLPFTQSLYPDEKVAYVMETELVPWDYSAQRRYRLFGVQRNDDGTAPYEPVGLASHVYYVDMGKASKWPSGPFLLVSAFTSSAQEMAEDCEAQRDDDFAVRVVQEALENSTLVADHVRQAEEKRELIYNRSNFGRYHKVQRNEHRWSATRTRTEAAQ